MKRVWTVIRYRKNHVKYSVGLAVVVFSTIVAGSGVDDSLSTRLDSVAYTNETRDLVAGEGRVTAQVSRSGVVTLDGYYEGLASPVTRIVVLKGPRTGVPGKEQLASFDVDPPATRGTFSKSFQSTKANRDALMAGHVYVQLATETAPDGALWGWIVRARDAFGESIPSEP